VLTLGVFNAGGLLMKSHATLYIDMTASLRGSTNGSHWIAQYDAVATMGGNLYNNVGRVIVGYAAHNIAVVGEGVVDAQSNSSSRA
jgi:polygalacturonase